MISAWDRIRATLTWSNMVLMVVGASFGLVFAEGGYRYYLVHNLDTVVPLRKTPEPSPRFMFGSYPALWSFDREVGWKFRPEGYFRGIIDNGLLVGCSLFDLMNAQGRLASRETDWEAAEIRGALVGSSYTMGPVDGETLFHEALGMRLGEALSRDVKIENFSMDSYGFVQMVDMAAVVASRHGPDFIVIAFNSAALSVNRHWRLLKPVGDGFYDFYMMGSPDLQDPDPFSARLHHYVISDRVTAEWCSRMDEAAKTENEAMLRGDPLVRSLTARHRLNHGRRYDPVVVVDFWSLRVSLAYKRLVYGHPFWNMEIFAAPENPNPVRPLAFDTYAADAAFLESVRNLKATGVPFYVVHVPSYPEIMNNDEWAAVGAGAVPAARERALAASLGPVLQVPIHSLLPRIGAPRSDAADLANKAHDPFPDWHPNPAGVRLFVRATGDLLLEEHFSKQPPSH